MHIKDVEQRTGLSRANIRYYEQEGLVHPARRKNGYRDYSPDDLETLLRVRLLRRLDVPIEEIRSMQAGKLSLYEALSQRLAALRRREEQARLIGASGRNPHYLKGLLLHQDVRGTANLEEALAGTERVILAVPTQSVRPLLESLPPSAGPKRWLNLAKGLEIATGDLVHRVVASLRPKDPYSVLSGPSHAEEVALGLPTAVVAASRDLEEARAWQDLLNGPRFRVYTGEDVVGTEAGGALKNVVAVAAGIARAMGLGDNALAALATRGLAEMTRVAVRLGADPLTLSGLAGVGDLLATCYSLHSRNLRLGLAVGAGKTLEEARAELGQVAEGAFTVQAVVRHGERLGLDLPIAWGVHRVLFEGASPRLLMEDLLSRDPKPERPEASPL